MSFPSATNLWNNLLHEIKQLSSISLLKCHLQRGDCIVYRHYTGSRKSEILVCRLRLQMSNLKHDLFRCHLTTDSVFECGAAVEDVAHFLLMLVCPLFQQSRVDTIIFCLMTLKLTFLHCCLQTG